VTALTGQVSDVLVIGGGIVGAGIARNAALRGRQTGPIEQRDFAFGSSSRSSRLLHGGLRYLAQGRVGLVREASVEKMVLRRIAPNLVEPLAFIFPAYCGTDWPLWQLRIAVKFYDLLCGGNNFGVSGSLTRAEALRRLPALKPERLAGAGAPRGRTSTWEATSWGAVSSPGQEPQEPIYQSFNRRSDEQY